MDNIHLIDSKGNRLIMSQGELDDYNSSKDNPPLSIDDDYYHSLGYKPIDEIKEIINIRHVDTSDCIDVETAYQEIVDSVMKIYKENNAL